MAKGFEYFEKAIEIDPEYTRAMFYKGLLYRELQKLTKEEAKRKEYEQMADQDRRGSDRVAEEERGRRRREKGAVSKGSDQLTLNRQITIPKKMAGRVSNPSGHSTLEPIAIVCMGPSANLFNRQKSHIYLQPARELRILLTLLKRSLQIANRI